MSFALSLLRNRSSNLVLRASRLSLLLIFIGLLQACAGGAQTPNLSYDFGPINQEQKVRNDTTFDARKISIRIADISAPVTLDSNAMLYRLAYDNAQLLRPYAHHHWSMPPAQLFALRFKSRISASGGIVLAAADGVADLPLLKIELDEFSQVFTNTLQSEAKIALRVSVIKKNQLVAQRYFSFATASASADAGGGAKAMQITADQSINAILGWFQTLPIH